MCFGTKCAPANTLDQPTLETDEVRMPRVVLPDTRVCQRVNPAELASTWKHLHVSSRFNYVDIIGPARIRNGYYYSRIEIKCTRFELQSTS